MTPSSLSPHYAAQSPSGRKPDLVAKEVLEWWQTNGKHPFIQPHISSPSNVGANSPENLPLGDKVQLIRLPVASPSAVKEFSQVCSEEPAHLTTELTATKRQFIDFAKVFCKLSVLVRFRVLWKSLPDLVLHYNYASMARETLTCTVVNGTHESGDDEGSIYS
ncbi:hypothetical protein J3Q64DRAFT_1696347 [Phycomyces blakesleeanus]|uniref:Uncharacterized protein n=1 Tax=Phycomyces blakesleeanus TaxID=4837 RepID=A0ABR3B4B3_PHYBL